MDVHPEQEQLELNGRQVYLPGKHGSRESRTAYHRVVAEAGAP